MKSSSVKQILLVYTVTAFSIIKAANIYNYDYCDQIEDVQHIAGAEVQAGFRRNNEKFTRECARIFKAKTENEELLVQIMNINVRRGQDSCIDKLTVIEIVDSQRHTLLKEFCGSHADLPIENKFYTSRGGKLLISFSRQPSEDSAVGSIFSIVLTSISKQPVVCNPSSHLRCQNDDCIAQSLVCDGIQHCVGGEDEIACSKVETVTEQASGDDSKTYLYLPVIVIAIFTLIMVSLILIGRKAALSQDSSELVSDEVGRSSSQLNSNPGYSESNGPPTPPPTYSYIERQTSYVSDISQRSSQISEPPDYEDALDMPDSPTGRRRSRRRGPLSRSSTGSSRRNRSRFRFFRSFSAQDSGSRYRNRNSAPMELVGSGRTSQLTSETDTLPSLREQDDSASPSDDVFDSPTSTIETAQQMGSEALQQSVPDDYEPQGASASSRANADAEAQQHLLGETTVSIEANNNGSATNLSNKLNEYSA